MSEKTDESWDIWYHNMQEQIRYSMSWSDSILTNIYGTPPYGQKMNLSSEDLLVEIGHLLHHNNKMLGMIAGLLLMEEVRKHEAKS